MEFDLFSVHFCVFPNELSFFLLMGRIRFAAPASIFDHRYSGTQNWTDIVSIDCLLTDIAGLKKNGTVVVEGSKGFYLNSLAEQVSRWQDIISIACGYGFIAGLRRDGTVVVASSEDSMGREAQKWKNVVSIAAGPCILVGIVGPAG